MSIPLTTREKTQSILGFPQTKTKMDKEVRFISTSKSANELDILDELTSLMMSDLNSIRKDKFKDFINREAIVG